MERTIAEPASSPQRRRRLRLAISLLSAAVLLASIVAAAKVASNAHAASARTSTAINCLQPPAGTDLSTVSPHQLRRYGISSALATSPRWKTIAPHLKHHYCFPATRPVPAVQHGLMQPQQSDDTSCGSSCIAGLEGDTPSDFPVTFAHGSWVVPCATYDVANEIVDTWVGVGGLEGSGPLVRVGVRQQKVTSIIYPPPANDPVQYTYFQDTADPSTAGMQAGFGVSCGDQIEAYYWHFVGQPVELSAIDDTTGDYFDVLVNPTIDMTNVACAVEDPPDGVGLPGFGTITFSDCEASNNGRGGSGMFAFPSSVQRVMPLTYLVIGDFPDGSIFSVIQGCPGCPPE